MILDPHAREDTPESGMTFLIVPPLSRGGAGTALTDPDARLRKGEGQKSRAMIDDENPKQGAST